MDYSKKMKVLSNSFLKLITIFKIILSKSLDCHKFYELISKFNNFTGLRNTKNKTYLGGYNRCKYDYIYSNN